MPHSIINYQGDGVTDTWSINFTLGYMSREDVTAWIVGEVDGTDQPIFRTITWITDTTVQISGALPQTGETLRFTRTTRVDIPAHDFADGASMNEAHFDENQLQMLFLAQEIRDGRLDALGNALNFGNQRAINMADPIDDTDGVNKRFLEAFVLATLTGGSGSLFNFTTLGDTPQNYVGHGDKILTVASTENGISFSTTDALLQASSGPGYQGIVNISGSTPVVDAWRHNLVVADVSSTTTITVTDSAITWNIGQSCDFMLKGTGELEFVPGVGTLIHYTATNESKVTVRNGFASLIKIDSAQYALVGHTTV